MDNYDTIRIYLTEDDLKQEFMSRMSDYTIWSTLEYFLDEDSFNKSGYIMDSWQSLENNSKDWLVAITYLVGKDTVEKWKEEFKEDFIKDIPNGRIIDVGFTCTCKNCKEHYLENCINKAYNMIIESLDEYIKDDCPIDDITAICWTRSFRVILGLSENSNNIELQECFCDLLEEYLKLEKYLRKHNIEYLENTDDEEDKEEHEVFTSITSRYEDNLIKIMKIVNNIDIIKEWRKGFI